MGKESKDDFDFSQLEGGAFDESQLDDMLNNFLIDDVAQSNTPEDEALAALLSSDTFESPKDEALAALLSSVTFENPEDEALAELLSSDAFENPEDEALAALLSSDAYESPEDEALAELLNSDIFNSTEDAQLAELLNSDIFNSPEDAELEALINSDAFNQSLSEEEQLNRLLSSELFADISSEEEQLNQLLALEETEADGQKSMDFTQEAAIRQEPLKERVKSPRQEQAQSASETDDLLRQVGKTLENSKKLLRDMDDIARKSLPRKIREGQTEQDDNEIEFWYDNERIEYRMMKRLAKALTLYDNILILLNRSKRLREKLKELGIDLKPYAAAEKAEDNSQALAMMRDTLLSEVATEEGLLIELNENEKLEAMTFLDDLMKKIDRIKKGELEEEIALTQTTGQAAADLKQNASPAPTETVGEKQSDESREQKESENELKEKSEKMGFDEKSSVMKESGKEE